MPLDLTATLTPGEFPADRPAAVSLELVLRNRGDSAATVYVGFAPAPVAGPAGPFFGFWLRTRDGRLHQTLTLRTNYQPPAMAPASYVTSHARRLRAGDAHATRVPCAWYPRGSLAPEALSLATLDPEGMDGLAPHDLSRCALLVLARTLDETERDRAERTGFLRPGFFLAFDGSGPHELLCTYALTGVGAFRPPREEAIEAPAIPLTIP